MRREQNWQHAATEDGAVMSVTAIVDESLRDVVADIVGDPVFVDRGTADFELRRLTIDRWSLVVDGRLTSGPPGFVLAQIIEVLNQQAAGSLEDRVALHAASIATKVGIVSLAGPSGAGKSTLAAAAVMRGYGYVADEISAVDVVDGCDVRAFHRPIGLRAGGAAALGIEIPPTDDGRYDMVYPWPPERVGTLAPGGRLAAVAIVSRVATLEEVGDHPVREIPPALAFARMMQHTVVPTGAVLESSERDQVSSAFERMRVIATEVPIFDLTYCQPDDGVRVVDDLIARLERDAGGTQPIE